MDKFSVTNLKKQLFQKTKEDLIKEIATLCQIFPQVKEYYKSQSGDIHELAKKYKDIIKKEFVNDDRRGLPKARFSVARKALTDFKKLTNDPELIADIMMIYVESTSWFNTEYGPDGEEFYTRSEDMFEKVLSLIKKHNLLEKFRARSHQVVKNATEGWGHKDSLEDRYIDVYGKFLD